MELVAALVAVVAVIATLLMAVAVGRGLLVRYRMRRREQRFLDFGSAAAPEPSGDPAQLVPARLVVLAAAYRTTLLLGLLALALLIVGGLVNRALGVVLAAVVVGAAGWREARRDGARGWRRCSRPRCA